MNKEKLAYRPYPLKRRMTVNGYQFHTIVISSHYEKEHVSYMNDDKILKITKQLDKRNDFNPHRQGKLSKGVE